MQQKLKSRALKLNARATSIDNAQRTDLSSGRTRSRRTRERQDPQRTDKHRWQRRRVQAAARLSKNAQTNARAQCHDEVHGR
jgi:hypothetical protein